MAGLQFRVGGRAAEAIGRVPVAPLRPQVDGDGAVAGAPDRGRTPSLWAQLRSANEALLESIPAAVAAGTVAMVTGTAVEVRAAISLATCGPDGRWHTPEGAEHLLPVAAGLVAAGVTWEIGVVTFHLGGRLADGVRQLCGQR